jgi:hypothetical protein
MMYIFFVILALLFARITSTPFRETVREHVHEEPTVTYSVDKGMVELFLMRNDLDLTTKDDQGLTVMDLAQDKPAIREILEVYAKARRRQESSEQGKVQ